MYYEIEQMQRLIKEQDGAQIYYDPASLPWTKTVESSWKVIRQELDRLLMAIDLLPGFEEIQVEQEEITSDHRWKIFPLFAHGSWFEKNQSRCPETAKVLRAIPGLRVGMFSILQAGKEIPPHCGPYSGILRYHLGLKIPSPNTLCGISVGEEVAHWEEGASLLFDDTHMHYAWNRSSEDRVVLFLDITRPLPAGLAAKNEAVISLIGESEFITAAAEKWELWEGMYGERLDQHLSALTTAAGGAPLD